MDSDLRSLFRALQTLSPEEKISLFNKEFKELGLFFLPSSVREAWRKKIEGYYCPFCIFYDPELDKILPRTHTKDCLGAELLKHGL